MEANLARADDRIVEINVAYWHKTDVRRAPIHVRSSGINGHSENASIGTERTLHRRQFMSVFGGKAEVTRTDGDFRFTRTGHGHKETPILKRGVDRYLPSSFLANDHRLSCDQPLQARIAKSGFTHPLHALRA